jgi:hypothetical protein
MAKQLSSKAAPEGASTNEGATTLNETENNASAEGAKDEQSNGAEGTEAAQAPKPATKPAEGFLASKDVKVGEKYKFYNTQIHTTRDPYSGVTFPAGNFTPEEVEVNQWIKSQVDSDLIRAKK